MKRNGRLFLAAMDEGANGGPAPAFGAGRGARAPSLDRIDALAAEVDGRHPGTAAHSANVVSLALRAGRELGLGRRGMHELELTARLHDVGKARVPDSILLKAGPLNGREAAVMRRHPEWGARKLHAIPGLGRIAHPVLHHHERFDGSGYPSGLRGDEIPLASRIVAACDAYDAMTTDRPYRRALGHAFAMHELMERSGTQFDPWVVAGLAEALATGAAPLAGAAA